MEHASKQVVGLLSLGVLSEASRFNTANHMVDGAGMVVGARATKSKMYASVAGRKEGRR